MCSNTRLIPVNEQEVLKHQFITTDYSIPANNSLITFKKKILVLMSRRGPFANLCKEQLIEDKTYMQDIIKIAFNMVAKDFGKTKQQKQNKFIEIEDME